MTSEREMLRKGLGRDLIKELNTVKHKYSPEYEKYWNTHVKPEASFRAHEIREEIEKLTKILYTVEKLKYPLSDVELIRLLKKLGYKT